MNSLLKKVMTGCFAFFLISENQDNIMLHPLVVLAANAGSSNADSSASEEVDLTSITIYDWLSDEARYIFDSADKKLFDTDIIKELNSLNKHFENVYFTNEERTKLSDLSVLSLLINKKVIKSSLNDAKKIVSDIENEYLSQMKTKYSSEQYNSMLKSSSEFESEGKHASICNPENVMISHYDKVLTVFPIEYNDYILISLDDVVNLIGQDYEIEYMKNNSNIVVKFGKNILEIEPGKPEVYINDSKQILDNPVLSYKQHIFISTDIFDCLDRYLSNSTLKTIQIAKDDSNEAKVIIF